jgi:hypothetical protein
MEIWKPVIGISDGYFDNLYEISSIGRFKSLSRKVSSYNGGRITKEKISNGTNCKGYRRIQLKKDNKVKQSDIHILVARAFIENPNPLKFNMINHLNSDKSDNRVENLEWCDAKRNAKHAYEAGKLKITKGVERATAILDDKKVLAIKLLYNTRRLSQYEISKIFNIGQTTIQNILNGKKWKHINL